MLTKADPAWDVSEGMLTAGIDLDDHEQVQGALVATLLGVRSFCHVEGYNYFALEDLARDEWARMPSE